MARVTVEDCIEIIPNRFELVTVAAQRTRQIASGGPLTIERDNDKDTVVSLREIADKTVSPETLIEEVILSHQKYGKADTMDDTEQLQIGSAEEMKSEAEEELSSLQTADEDLEGEELGAGDEELIGKAAPEGMTFGEDDVVNADD